MAEKQLRRLVGKYGVPPASGKLIQVAIIQSTLLYGAKLTWTGKAPEAKDYQLAINRMARGMLGAFPSTPLVPLLAESGLTPVMPLLDHRQTRYVQRTSWQPTGTRGTKEILLQMQNSALSRRLKEMTLLQYNNMEKSYLETGKAFEGDIMPDSEEIIAKRVAEEWPHRINTVSTDGSRLDDGKVGGCVAWSDSSGEWIGEKMHQGTNKEVCDAEIHAIERAIHLFTEINEEGQQYTIFSDSKSAIERCRNDIRGPGQATARTIIDGSLRLAINRCTITLRWVPEHQGVEGNVQADRWAKEAAEG